MAEAARAILPRHVRRKRPSFVLTSLIDVIFLLVIFFMVSSQIVPFSLIGLGPIAGDESTPAIPQLAATDSVAPVALRIQAGQVRIGGVSVALAALAGTLADLRANGVSALILIPTATATVQDVVAVLESVKQAGIASVTVLNRSGQT